jgi:Zn-dependent peptidase ImmA (M78 family)/DNA-binding XRE family transcriptional regulator
MNGLGARLKMARRMAGISQRDLADAAGVSAMAISKYERDMDVPGSAVLIRLVQALGVKVEFLLRPTSVHLSSPAYRRRASLPEREQDAILARVHEWLERYLAIENLVSQSPTFDVPVAIDRNVSSLADVERIVLELRQEWNLGWDPIENLTQVLEDHGVKVGQLDAHEDFDALTLWANDTFPVIVVKHGLPGDRQRYNLAHELGHLVIRPAAGVDAEKAAHRFAGAFLAPEPMARPDLGERRVTLDLLELHLLKHKYGLSMQAWIYRAKDLGIISEASATQLFKEFRRRGWHLKEPGDAIPPEESARSTRLVLRALTEDVISEGRAAELLGMPLARFWQQEGEQHEGFPVALRC